LKNAVNFHTIYLNNKKGKSCTRESHTHITIEIDTSSESSAG